MHKVVHKYDSKSTEKFCNNNVVFLQPYHAIVNDINMISEFDSESCAIEDHHTIVNDIINMQRTS